MMKDSSPALICCGDVESQDAIKQIWPDAPPQFLFDEIFASQGQCGVEVRRFRIRSGDDHLHLRHIGRSKRCGHHAANVGFILEWTAARLDILMSGANRTGTCVSLFAVLFLCFLDRGADLSIAGQSGDLEYRSHEDFRRNARLRPRIISSMFLQLLERMRRAVDEQIWKTGGIILAIYSRAKAAWSRKQEGKAQVMDGLWLGLANALVFPAIRKKMIGPKLRGLISGSAPLNIETQHYFSMLGIPVLQVYGLTETTGICTMDDPRQLFPAALGPAIAGMEMKLGENDEIIVRGTQCFSGLLEPSCSRPPKFCAKDGFTPGIRAKWTRQVTGALRGGSRI